MNNIFYYSVKSTFVAFLVLNFIRYKLNLLLLRFVLHGTASGSYLNHTTITQYILIGIVLSIRPISAFTSKVFLAKAKFRFERSSAAIKVELYHKALIVKQFFIQIPNPF